MQHVLVLFWSFILIAGCSAGCTNSRSDIILIQPRMSHVIFIPGFYGTRLVQASDGKVVWISASQAVFGSQTAARTGLAVPGAIELAPGSLLDRVPVLPGIYGLDVYGDFLDDLRANLGSDSQIHLFGYDWREDYFQAVKKLARLVDQLKSQGATSIALVAHSLGGLIASYYLRYGDQVPEDAVETWQGARHIDKVVMAAVPFKGSMTAFRNMKHGAKFGLNYTLIKPHAFASFTSSYQLQPIYQPVLLDHELEPLSHSLSDSDLWRQHGWGFLQPTAEVSQDMMDNRMSFVQHALRRGKMLSERLHAPLGKLPEITTNLLYAFATSHATIARAVLIDTPGESSSQLIFGTKNFEKHFPAHSPNSLFADGDQTVLTESAQLPAALQRAWHNASIHESRAIHSQIYNDPALRAKIRHFLASEAQTNKANENSTPLKTTAKKQ